MAKEKNELRLNIILKGRAGDTTLIDVSMNFFAAFQFEGSREEVEQMIGTSEELQFALYSQVHPLTMREFGRLLGLLGARIDEGIPLGVALIPRDGEKAAAPAG